jgi:thiol-disulfide isomerase/thioredoxin
MGLALAGLVLAGTVFAVEREEVPDVRLEQFTLGDVMNGVAFQPDLLKGSPVVLEFWGVHCPPCVASLPDLVKLQRHNAAKGLKIVGVHSQTASDEEVLKVLEKARVQYPILRDGQSPVLFSGIPRVFVFDRTGKLTWMGSPHDSAFDKAVRAVLK